MRDISIGPSRTIRACLLTLCLILVVSSGAAIAQRDSGLAWYKVVTIPRVKKLNRQTVKPLPKQQRAPLLTFQWHLLKRVDDNITEQADPSTIFDTGDQLKLAITVNQNGYLYIINQPEGKDGVVMFPEPKIRKGQNFVLKNQSYTVPDFCYNPNNPAEFKDPRDCWFEMSPPAGSETLLVIFSREKITTLPNIALKPHAVVKRDTIEALIGDSEQRVKEETGELKTPSGKTLRYATRVQNTNEKDNEELIATIKLNHAG
jgi:hypothetical protein